MKGKLIFKPIFVQRGSGPNLLDWAYASDENWDAFYSDINVSKEGVVISETFGKEKFGINVRWNVEGFGYLFITADNGGKFYTLPEDKNEVVLNLNYELAKSRIVRNRERIALHKKDGWSPSTEVMAFNDLSESLFKDATNCLNDENKCGYYSQKCLLYAMKTSELIELDKVNFDINKKNKRDNFFIGCDARGFNQMDPDLFLELFSQLFNYTTITHYLVSSVYQDFEPIEGKKQFNLRKLVLDELKKRNITVEGRPLFWFYRTVTPDWLRKKDFDSLMKYVEDHTKKVMNFYGNDIYAWEIVNEAHDWANELRLKPEQIIELTKFACDVAEYVNPQIHRLINNCCPYAEYVQLKKWGELDATYPQRTPYQFMKDLADAGVNFTITGQQMYFPYRDISDIIILLERLKDFNRPVHITEIGASSGPTEESVKTGILEIPNEPYAWHRHWDEELQADWIEALYSYAYSKSWIEAINWYDFVDPFSWIKGGGILKSPKGEKKLSFDRILLLRKKWGIN